jgi:hypothetical protein
VSHPRVAPRLAAALLPPHYGSRSLPHRWPPPITSGLPSGWTPEPCLPLRNVPPEPKPVLWSQAAVPAIPLLAVTSSERTLLAMQAMLLATQRRSGRLQWLLLDDA